MDYINLMTYDYYGPWTEYTGFNSPLYASPIESDWEKKNLNIDVSYNQWLKKGASANKLMIGLAFYGRSFKLKDSQKHGIHAPFSGPGVDDGAPNYRAVCQINYPHKSIFLKKIFFLIKICSKYKDWERVWDDHQKVPSKQKGNEWIGYDDEQSIRLKVKT